MEISAAKKIGVPIKEKASPREIGPAKEVVPSIAMQIFSLFVLSSVIVTKLRAH